MLNASKAELAKQALKGNCMNLNLYDHAKAAASARLSSGRPTALTG
jgi:hypothetical protein